VKGLGAAAWGALALLPIITQNTYFLNGMILVFVYGTAAQAWNLLGGFAGQLSFGHVVFFGIGAYTSTLLLSRAGVTPWIGMWAGAGAAVVLSLVVGYPTFRLRRHYFALATLALAEMVRILFLNWPLVGAAEGLYLPIRLMNRSWAMIWTAKPPYYYLALVIFALACAIALVINRARLGLYLRTIDQDEDAAAALGIPARRYKLLVMAVSAALTALAGSVFAQYILYVDPSTVLDPSRSVLFAVMTLLGGRGTVVGPAIGAGFLTLLSQYAGGTLGGLGRGYDYVVYGFAIMLAAVYEPRGLVGVIERVRRRPPSDRVPLSVRTSPSAAGDSLRSRSSGAPLLRAAGLSKRFGGLQALQDVDLEVRRGEIVGILGPNGAGKSTVFDCVTGFLPASAGRVMLHTARGDQVLTGHPPHWIAQQGLARTFQVIRVFPDLTVRESLLVSQEHRGEPLGAAFRQSPPEVCERADAFLRAVGLDELRDAPAGTLSYGQQKLLALAVALMRHPLLVLLDEPVAGVNPTTIEYLKRYIRAQNAAGMTFLIIEHNIEVLMDLADRLYFLADGRVVAQGPPEAIQRSEEVLRLYYGR
jgi:branched-chain amino acid transport system permease protein